MNLKLRMERIRKLNYDFDSRPKRRINSCNLCGESLFTIISHQDRYGYSAGAYSCDTCGLTFINPVMTEEAYGEFYSKVYRPLVSAYHGRLIDASTIQEEQLDYAKGLVKFLRPWADKSPMRNLLDIGGSTGIVAVELAKSLRIKATVLDPAADELVYAKRNGLETISGFLEQYEPGKNRYDLITLCQTIDHLLDAMGSLHKIRSLLSSKGLFYIDVVDFRAAYLRNKSVTAAIKIDHPYYFTEDTVEAMLGRAGLKILQKSFLPDALHIGYLCSKGNKIPSALPAKSNVREFFREVRAIQNARE